MFHPRRAASLLAPVALLCLFAALLPATLPHSGFAPSSEACLTMADTAPAPGPTALDRMERCSRLVAPDVQLMADLGATYEAEQATAKAVTIYRRALTVDPGTRSCACGWRAWRSGAATSMKPGAKRNRRCAFSRIGRP